MVYETYITAENISYSPLEIWLDENCLQYSDIRVLTDSNIRM